MLRETYVYSRIEPLGGGCCLWIIKGFDGGHGIDRESEVAAEQRAKRHRVAFRRKISAGPQHLKDKDVGES